MGLIHSISDIKVLSEGIDLECKLAAGRDNKGELPKKTFWETYSAFANTNGGIILLGVKEEKNHSFSIVGIGDTQKILDELWAAVNNPQTISCNLLSEEMVSVIAIDDKEIIKVEVPRASRHVKPVYRAANPLTGTYQRLHSSDVRCSNETVKQMLAEQVEDTRDDKLLENFNITDLDPDTLKRYRIMYSNREPESTRVEYSDIEFLRSIGAWKKDRQTGKEGLTIAGLLMFGKLMPIQEIYPNYLLDYQERDESSNVRWVDRVSLDGTWSGNIFDFYLKVVKKLIADLKVPFKLIGDKRENNTHIHDAIREAFVNSLVHADYTGKASILAVKNNNSFSFRNPGLMRISVAQAISGYEHDCRNQKIHQMFHFLGLGERAGSGIPNIFKWWGDNHWLKPSIFEKLEPYDQTVMELKMSDVPKNEPVNEPVNEREQIILKIMLDNPEISMETIAQKCNVSIATIKRDIAKLKESGFVKRVGSFKRGHWEIDGKGLTT